MLPGCRGGVATEELFELQHFSLVLFFSVPLSLSLSLYNPPRRFAAQLFPTPRGALRALLLSSCPISFCRSVLVLALALREVIPKQVDILATVSLVFAASLASIYPFIR